MMRIYIFMIFSLLFGSCKYDKYANLSDEELCEKYEEANQIFFKPKKGAGLIRELRIEVEKRQKIRYDSTRNNIAYYTILSPACSPAVEVLNDEGLRVKIMRTQEVAALENLHQWKYGTLNGNVIYDFIQNEDGELVRKEIRKMEYTGGIYCITIRSDQVPLNSYFEGIVRLNLDMFIKDFELSIETHDGGIKTIKNKDDFQEVDKDYLNIYRYRVKANSLGKRLFKGTLKMKYENEWKEINFEYKYIVVDKTPPGARLSK